MKRLETYCALIPLYKSKLHLLQVDEIGPGPQLK